MTHTVLLTLAGYFVFAAAAGAMAPPLPAQERGFYGWTFRFTQILAANFSRLVQARFPALAAPAPEPGADTLTATRTKVESVQITSSDARSPS